MLVALFSTSFLVEKQSMETIEFVVLGLVFQFVNNWFSSRLAFEKSVAFLHY